MSVSSNSPWKLIPKRKDFRESDTKFDGNSKDYPAFKDGLRSIFGNKQIGYLLQSRDQAPIIPRSLKVSQDEALHKRIEVEKHNMLVHKEKQKSDREYELGISLLIGKLDHTPMTRVNKIYRNNVLNVQDKFYSLLGKLDSLYGINEDAVASE